MKKILVLILLIMGCQNSIEMEPGRWIGTLSPMNHPEMENPLKYDVSYVDAKLVIDIIGSDNTMIKTRDPRIQNDTLYFSFEEPEEQVLLLCKMAGVRDQEFSGRCTDKSGKWAYFTMRYPKND